MGTTLTGTTPQDTYESLIKVADNGPLSATAKFLSDGEGTDSVLALSTTALGIGTASPTSLAQLNGTAGTAHLRVSEAGTTIGFVGGANGIISGVTGQLAVRAEAGLVLSSAGNSQTMVLTSTGNVGIGTSAPAADSKLHVVRASSGVTARTDLSGTIIAEGSTRSGLYILTEGTDAGSFGSIFWGNGNNNTDASIIVNNSTRAMSFAVADAERFRITPNGVTFNGDTAAANALDDYEEGTWSPSFSGASITTGSLIARYTKIGRQVTVQLSFINETISSASGEAGIAGLPFTVNATGFFAGSLNFANAITTDASVRVSQNGTSIGFSQGTGVTAANFNDGTSNRSLMLTITYFV